MIFIYNPRFDEYPHHFDDPGGFRMSAQTRIGLIITLLGSLLAAELLQAQAARPIRATRLQRIPGALPAGAVPLPVGQIPPGARPKNTFPPLPPNHFVGQDCSQLPRAGFHGGLSRFHCDSRLRRHGATQRLGSRLRSPPSPSPMRYGRRPSPDRAASRRYLQAPTRSCLRRVEGDAG